MTDEWALPYIDIKWLQPIVESFDEDGSGYVTIAEINNFTQSRPTELGWRYYILYCASDGACPDSSLMLFEP